MWNGKKIFTLLFIVTAILLTACSEDSNSDTETDNGEEGKLNERVSLATAGSGGAWYPIGGGMANIVNDQESGLEMAAAVTNGAIENVRLVNDDLHQFAFVNKDAAYWGYSGTDLFEDEGKKDILGMFNLYPSVFQAVVLEDSGIESIGDLKGKKVVVGPPASTSEVMGWIVLEHYGITADDIEGQTISFEEGADALRDGNVDALFVMSAFPNSQIMNLQATHDVKLLSVEDEIRASVLSEIEYYNEITLEAGSADGLDEDIHTLAIDSMIIANSNVSEEVAYEFTKSIFENLPEVQEFHSVAERITEEGATDTLIPMHPGAKKYFEEVGLEVEE